MPLISNSIVIKNDVLNATPSAPKVQVEVAPVVAPVVANTTPGNTIIHQIISATNIDTAQKVLYNIHNVQYDDQHHLLIVDGKAKKINKASAYLLDMLTLETE